MKCIKQYPGHANLSLPMIVRVTDKEAAKRVASGKWVYSNRKAWKDTGRHYGDSPRIAARARRDAESR